MTLGYDPLGACGQTEASAATTDFLLRRCRLEPVDEPILANLSDGCYLIGDHQGVIIAANGASTTRYAYAPTSEPGSWRGARFRYAG